MPAHTPDHLTDLLDRYGLSMDTDMEKIIIKVTKEHFLLIPKEMILQVKNKGLWELMIHNSGDQILAPGNVSLC